MHNQTLIICHDCDLIQRKPDTLVEGTIRCVQCDAVLQKSAKNNFDTTLALVLAGIILFILINMFPFLTFRMSGQIQETTLITGIQMFFIQGWWPLGLLVFLATIFSPALHLLGLLYVLLPMRLGLDVPGIPRIMRIMTVFQPWNMVEIFMLGIFVTVVKLSHDGEITPGISLFAFMAYTFVQAAIFYSFNPFLIWQKCKYGSTPHFDNRNCGSNLIQCHVCDLISSADHRTEPFTCQSMRRQPSQTKTGQYCPHLGTGFDSRHFLYPGQCFSDYQYYLIWRLYNRYDFERRNLFC